MTSGTNSRDLDARATLLHALSTRRAATFEMANSLNRERQSLSNTALAYLALTFANLNRPELAGEVLGILTPRAKAEAVAPGRRARLYWEGSSQSAGARGTVETTALVSLAFARVRPQAPELDQAIDWLHAHRFGHGWNPHKAKGPALAALALYHGRAKGAEDRYRLTVTVNDTKVAELAVRRLGREPGHRRAREGPQGRRPQSRRPRHGRARHVRLRGHPDRLHPRLRPRPGPGQPAGLGRPPRLLARPARARRQGPARRLRRGRQPDARSRTPPPRSPWAARPASASPSGGTSPPRRPNGSATSWSSRSICPPARR